jgi:hypothetical protein
MQYLDVDVLVEGSGKPVTRRWKHTPTSAAGGRVCYGRLVCRITESEDWKRFEGPVEINGPVSGASTGSDWHVGVKVSYNDMSDKRDRR